MKRLRGRVSRVALALALLAVLAVGAVWADGPVLWKQYCPQHYAVELVKEGEGVHVVCVRGAMEADDKVTR